MQRANVEYFLFHKKLGCYDRGKYSSLTVKQPSLFSRKVFPSKNSMLLFGNFCVSKHFAVWGRSRGLVVVGLEGRGFQSNEGTFGLKKVSVLSFTTNFQKVFVIFDQIILFLAFNLLFGLTYFVDWFRRASMTKRSRFTSVPLQSVKKCWALTTPTQHKAATTLLCYFKTRFVFVQWCCVFDVEVIGWCR